MIHIIETKPIKLSGISSFCITFDYNPAIVDAIKALPTFYYHKKSYTWEIPADCLTVALESLTFLDDITLQLLAIQPDSKTGRFHLSRKYNLDPLSEAEKTAFKASPFPHQLEAVDFLLQQEKALLLDGCGVGKSLEIILFAETLKAFSILSDVVERYNKITDNKDTKIFENDENVKRLLEKYSRL